MKKLLTEPNMKKPTIPYRPFDTFVFRTPLFPYNDQRKFPEMAGNPVFREAVFLGSPELYKEATENSLDKDRKLAESLCKYFNRSHTRCTPFGLFAGCSVGKLADDTRIELTDETQYRRCTRLDMNYLCALIQFREKQDAVREQLRYYPNDSIYELAGKLRYIEYFYRTTKRIHQINSVEPSEYLDKIFATAQTGATIRQLAESVVEEDISYEEAEAFILELIDSQLLKSELEAGVTGGDLLDTLIGKLQRLNDVPQLPQLIRIKEYLQTIDASAPGDSIGYYDRIIDIIKRIGVPFEPKFLFQTDLIKPARQAGVSQDVISKIGEVLGFLNRITPPRGETNLSQFASAFYERFEEQEITLVHALDKEAGIGYPVSTQNTGDVNELIDNLQLPYRQSPGSQIYFSWLDGILLDKYLESLKENRTCITLTDDDIPVKTANWDDLPDTLSVMCNLLGDAEGDGCKLHIKSAGGSCAGNLLGRFCHLDPQLFGLVKEIADAEQQLHPDIIYAEIAHLPESRIGNIAARPLFRDYEIHYLARSGVEIEKQIPVSDLMLSVKNGKVVLKSRKFGKKVMPRLTNAHNYSFNSMPIYHFLCDMQTQGIRGGLYFGWGELFNRFPYLPRVEYNGHILSLQSWNLSTDDIKDFDKLGDAALLAKMEELREKRHLPAEVIVPDGDNELYIDLRDALNIRTMLSLVKKRGRFKLTEFMFANDSAVVRNSQGESFANEFIFTFRKPKS